MILSEREYFPSKGMVGETEFRGHGVTNREIGNEKRESQGLLSKRSFGDNGITNLEIGNEDVGETTSVGEGPEGTTMKQRRWQGKRGESFTLSLVPLLSPPLPTRSQSPDWERTCLGNSVSLTSTL